MKKIIRTMVPSILGSGLTIAVFLLTGLNQREWFACLNKLEVTGPEIRLV